MQWWREQVHKLYDVNQQGQQHFLLSELSSAISKHDLTERWFDRILDARVHMQE